jgi:branched-chain amino acid transport system permease protein
MIDTALLFAQIINGCQFGFMLFLIAAGLTLTFGIMNFLNQAHGVLFMLGAFLAASLYEASGSFPVAVIGSVFGSFILGALLERGLLRPFYDKDHLDQILVTFGLVLIVNEGVRVVWGPAPLQMPIPALLDDVIELPFDIVVSRYRVFVLLVGAMVAAALYWIINRTRIGMLLRAAASDRETVAALGGNVSLIYSCVFAIGAAIASLAGALVAPLTTIESGMGDSLMILAFVVVVIGGPGSVRGALVSALVIGIFDTVGRTVLPRLLETLVNSELAMAAGPGIASMLVYVLMAMILIYRPSGLFPVAGRS